MSSRMEGSKKKGKMEKQKSKSTQKTQEKTTLKSVDQSSHKATGTKEKPPAKSPAEKTPPPSSEPKASGRRSKKTIEEVTCTSNLDNQKKSSSVSKVSGSELERLFNDIANNRSKFRLNPEFSSKIEMYCQYQFYIVNLQKALTEFSSENNANPPSPNPYESLASALSKSSMIFDHNSNMQKMVTIAKELGKIHVNYQERMTQSFVDLRELTENEKRQMTEDQELLKLLLIELNTLRQLIAVKGDIKEVEQKGKLYEDKLREFDLVAGRAMARCESMYARHHIIDGLLRQYLKDERKRYKEMTRTIFTHPVKPGLT